MYCLEHAPYQFFQQQEYLPVKMFFPFRSVEMRGGVAQQGKHSPSPTHSILGKSKMKISADL